MVITQIFVLGGNRKQPLALQSGSLTTRPTGDDDNRYNSVELFWDYRHDVLLSYYKAHVHLLVVHLGTIKRGINYDIVVMFYAIRDYYNLRITRSRGYNEKMFSRC